MPGKNQPWRINRFTLIPETQKEATRRRFTLIELLVVVAILMILASMLFPALQQAKRKARETVCMSNLKQWGVAALSHASDFDRHLPRAFGRSAPKYVTWPTNLRLDAPEDDWKNQGTNWQVFQQYGINDAIAQCPGMRFLKPARDSLRVYANNSGDAVRMEYAYVAGIDKLWHYKTRVSTPLRRVADKLSTATANSVIVGDEIVMQNNGILKGNHHRGAWRSLPDFQALSYADGHVGFDRAKKLYPGGQASTSDWSYRPQNNSGSWWYWEGSPK